jgi:DNA-binding NarL/FixJ family response regulator
LTPRERQVLTHIGCGLDTRAIASRLAVAHQTVRNYSAVIYQKIGVKTRVQAMVWAQDQGLASP